MDGDVARVFFNRRALEAFRSLGGAEPWSTVRRSTSSKPPRPSKSSSIFPAWLSDSVTATFTSGTLVVAGRKRAPLCAHREAAFHLAERTFGQFVCVVRCEVAVDAGRARATLGSGELHIMLPRVEDRRGAEIPITIAATPRPETT